jgi:tagatose 1,6-diphosphate aldolase
VHNLSLGKYYRLQKCSSTQGTLSVLAIDHRTSLEKAIKEKYKEFGDYTSLPDFKTDIVMHVGGAADSILLDPEIGGPKCIASNVLNRKKGLIISLEKSGYSGKSSLRRNELLHGWDLEKTIRMGADAVKLLVYYNPTAKNTSETEQLISKVSESCDKYEIPFFLETLTYSLNPQFDRIPGNERSIIVIETAQRLSQLGADVLKVEFPVDINLTSDRSFWADACRELTKVSQCPWILLSASVDFDTYVEQVTIACQQGCSGVAVGRAVWKEAVQIKSRPERIQFLSTIAYSRMKNINSICQKFSQPWMKYYSAPEIDENWYENY